MINFINALITGTAETQNNSTNCVVNDLECQYSPSLESFGNYELLT